MDHLALSVEPVRLGAEVVDVEVKERPNVVDDTCVDTHLVFQNTLNNLAWLGRLIVVRSQEDPIYPSASK